MTNLIKREVEVYKFLNKNLKNGLSVFIKYNYFNLIWRLLGKRSATKYCDKHPTIMKFRDGGKIRVKWLLHFISIHMDGEYTLKKEFEIKPGQTVIDIGANFGYYTYLASKKVGPEGKVIAIEPFPDYVNELKNNIEMNNLSNVILVDSAVSNKSGEMELFIGENFGSPSLVKQRGKPIKIKTTTLKEILNKNKISRIDILKMDIEGGELDVLKSSSDVLNNVDKIVLETHENTDEVIKLLRENGYSALGFDNGRIIYASRKND